MSSGETRCPRCGGGFHCGMRDAEPCACGSLELGPGLLRDLRERYTACLCLPCLRELAALHAAAGAETKKPAQS